jgi:hypothetical protein
LLAITLTFLNSCKKGVSGANGDEFNLEAQDYDGEVANITVRLSDSFGNPVPDNTVVSFTAEGGQIQSSCTTSGFLA